MVEPLHSCGTPQFLTQALGVDLLQAPMEIWVAPETFLGQGHVGIQNQRGRNGAAPMVALPSELTETAQLASVYFLVFDEPSGARRLLISQ